MFLNFTLRFSQNDTFQNGVHDFSICIDAIDAIKFDRYLCYYIF